MPQSIIRKTELQPEQTAQSLPARLRCPALADQTLPRAERFTQGLRQIEEQLGNALDESLAPSSNHGKSEEYARLLELTELYERLHTNGPRELTRWETAATDQEVSQSLKQLLTRRRSLDPKPLWHELGRISSNAALAGHPLIQEQLRQILAERSTSRWSRIMAFHALTRAPAPEHEALIVSVLNDEIDHAVRPHRFHTPREGRENMIHAAIEGLANFTSKEAAAALWAAAAKAPLPTEFLALQILSNHPSFRDPKRLLRHLRSDSVRVRQFVTQSLEGTEDAVALCMLDNAARYDNDPGVRACAKKALACSAERGCFPPPCRTVLDRLWLAGDRIRLWFCGDNPIV